MILFPTGSYDTGTLGLSGDVQSYGYVGTLMLDRTPIEGASIWGYDANGELSAFYVVFDSRPGFQSRNPPPSIREPGTPNAIGAAYIPAGFPWERASATGAIRGAAHIYKAPGSLAYRWSAEIQRREPVC